ncbi:MAG: inorganic phosphate transporter [bacterium]
MIIIIISSIIGLLMAFAIGANDVANSMATAVGAKAITIKQAVLIATVLEFAGAFFFGSMVAKTIGKGIVPLDKIPSEPVLIAGAISAIVGATIFIIIATLFELPVSTTHSIVGGMAGFGIIAIGFSAINWIKIFLIVLSWIISPIVGGLLAFFVFKAISNLILRKSNPFKATKKFGPYLIFATFFIIAWMFSQKTLHHHLLVSILVALGIGLIAGLCGFLIFRKINMTGDQQSSVEKIFKNLQVMTSCYVALAHGANDVANAIGPLAIVITVITSRSLTAADQSSIPKFLLALGGIGITLGIGILGHKVMKTIGEKITSLNNSRGFTIDFSTATAVIIASSLGMPISSTHTVVGSVIGVGYARGIEAVDFGVVKQIFLSWLITVPAAAVTSGLLYKFIIFRLILSLY